MKTTIVEVGEEKMERLFSFVLNKRLGTYYVKRGTILLGKGRKGLRCTIGKSLNQVCELVRHSSRNHIMCLRSIVRFTYNCQTKWYSVRFKGKIIKVGVADGIAGPGLDEKFPDLEYFSLVKRFRTE